jgi:hypothetical protein
MIIWGEALPERCRPHNLSGNWSNFTERHVLNDWVLIYRYIEGGVVFSRAFSCPLCAFLTGIQEENHGGRLPQAAARVTRSFGPSAFDCTPCNSVFSVVNFFPPCFVLLAKKGD